MCCVYVQKPSERTYLFIGHTDAVLALAWNENYNHVLGSGSVDESVLLWDLNIGKPSEDIRVFKEKVSLQLPFENSQVNSKLSYKNFLHLLLALKTILRLIYHVLYIYIFCMYCVFA